MIPATAFKSQLQKIREQLLPFGRQYRLGVELHALDLHAAVAQAHDEAVGRGGGDFQAVGQGVALDDERVVAPGWETVLEPLEDRPAVVADLRRLAVDGRGAAHDAAAEDLPDGLVAEAHAEQRHVAGERGDQLERDAGLVGRARPRRDDDAVGPYPVLDLLDRHLVVAPHRDLRVQFAEVLDEVVGERIVVVYQQNLLAHLGCPPSPALGFFLFAAAASCKTLATSARCAACAHWSAFFPSLLFAAGMAPWSRSIWTMRVLPFVAATIRGVPPTLLTTFGSAPLSSRSATRSSRS